MGWRVLERCVYVRQTKLLNGLRAAFPLCLAILTKKKTIWSAFYLRKSSSISAWTLRKYNVVNDTALNDFFQWYLQISKEFSSCYWVNGAWFRVQRPPSTPNTRAGTGPLWYQPEGLCKMNETIKNIHIPDRSFWELFTLMDHSRSLWGAVLTQFQSLMMFYLLERWIMAVAVLSWTVGTEIKENLSFIMDTHSPQKCPLLRSLRQ